MTSILELTLTPQEAYSPDLLDAIVRKRIPQSHDYRLAKRSIDARSRQVKVNLTLSVFPKEEIPALIEYHIPEKPVQAKHQAIIVGAGPAGLFAALRLLELGIKPIVLERGKDVQARRRDLAAINKEHVVNTESNYCFGEGGAGTYSDGKLYTRSKKRGDVRRILEILVAHGATHEILVDAHPHIGTNKLPKLVADLRESIIRLGGEVHFNTKVTDFILENGEMKGVVTEAGERLKGIAVILATGHSARDIFHLLHNHSISIEAKPFALGVRIEHAQSLIDQVQYHCETDRGPYLPASAYSLVQQTQYKGVERGVFSFCMCPGGFIVPAATAPGELVVNGMSPSRRDSRFANSGIVVAVELEDLQEYAHFGPLAAMEFQASVERKAWEMGGKTQVAPAQRMVDFVEGRVSKSLLDTSYQPGLKSVDMQDVLPPFIAKRLQMAFKEFGKKMKGYYTNEAQIIGVESRTSSPVRIPRNKETLEHISTSRLFPCAEGAGYAGGIVSAAMDGERCAEQVAALYAKY
ncbi:FAD-dependent monooxygenase [Cytophagales bacterium LB-30]|uniref:FAD-dependent monooxygenase n=1 Tax=Shiella aurantiaca TaxID=3058365 RepID=A0ABT8F0E6_9BACT|nr:FAD-dependent oxidoreductase [Shiella aurantiaca]MDN4163900.1 FAD-dependent monooxygenase [Shiella aurantiaca]